MRKHIKAFLLVLAVSVSAAGCFENMLGPDFSGLEEALEDCYFYDGSLYCE